MVLPPPACLCLPPVVEDWHPEVLLGPDPCSVVAVLARHKQVAQRAQVVRLGLARGGVVPFNGADGRGRHKHPVDAVRLNHAEELARVRGACKYIFMNLKMY